MTSLHQLIYALSDALDLVGVDDINHGKRVACMALECAEALNWRKSDKVKLFHASLLHDCGVSSTRIHDKLVFYLRLGRGGRPLHSRLPTLERLSGTCPPEQYHLVSPCPLVDAPDA